MTKPTKLPTWDSNQTRSTEPSASHQSDGWLVTGSIPEKPPLDYFNYWMNLVFLWIAEINTVGVLEWDSSTTYGVASYVLASDGSLYRSLSASNTGNDPVSSPANWLDVFSAINISFDDSSVGYVAGQVQAAFEAAYTYHINASNLSTGTLPGGRFDDTSHGNRSGGSLHSLVVASGSAGFMSGTDKAKLDGISAGGAIFVTNANDRTGSRAISTTYTNTTGRPMLVVVQVKGRGLGETGICSALIDGSTVQQAEALSITIGSGNDYGFDAPLVWVVPAGSTYRVNTSGTNVVQYWSEMD